MPSLALAFMFFISAVEPSAKPPKIDDEAIFITSASLSSSFLKTSRVSLGFLINEPGILTPCFLEITANAAATPAVLPITEAVLLKYQLYYCIEINLYYLFY